MPTRKIHPLAARIKRVMQSDSDVGKIAQTTPIAISNAVKLLLKELIQAGAQLAASEDSKTLTSSHLYRLVKTKLNELSFLTVLDKACLPQTVATVKRKRKNNNSNNSNNSGEAANEYGHLSKRKKSQKQGSQSGGVGGGIVLPEPPPLENITQSFTKFQQHNNNSSNSVEQSNGDFTQFNYIPLQQFQQNKNLNLKKNSSEITEAFDTNLQTSFNQFNNQQLLDQSLLELQEALRNQPINQQLFNNIFAQPPPLVPPLSHPSLPLDFKHFRQLNSQQQNLEKELLNKLLNLNQEAVQKSSNITSEQLLLELQQRLFASSQLPQLSEIINTFSEIQQKQPLQNQLPSNFENFLNISNPASLQFPPFQNIFSQLPTPFAAPSPCNILPLLPVAKPLEIRQSSRIKDEIEEKIQTEPSQKVDQGIQKMEVDDSENGQNLSKVESVQDVQNQIKSEKIQPLVVADTFNSMVGSSNFVEAQDNTNNTNIDQKLLTNKVDQQPDFQNLNLNLPSTQHKKTTSSDPKNFTTISTGFNTFQPAQNIDNKPIPSNLQNVFNSVISNDNIRESLLKYLYQLPGMAIGMNISPNQIFNEQNNFAPSSYTNNIQNLSMKLLQSSLPFAAGLNLSTLQPDINMNSTSQKIGYSQLQPQTLPEQLPTDNSQKEQNIQISTKQTTSNFSGGNTKQKSFQKFQSEENTASDVSKQKVQKKQQQQQQQSKVSSLQQAHSDISKNEHKSNEVSNVTKTIQEDTDIVSQQIQIPTQSQDVRFDAGISQPNQQIQGDKDIIQQDKQQQQQQIAGELQQQQQQQQQKSQYQQPSVAIGSQVNVGQLTQGRGLVDDAYRDLYQQEDDYDDL